MNSEFYMIENHPADSRVKFDNSGSCQTLSARMGTGGGNVPLLLVRSDVSRTPEEDGGNRAMSERPSDALAGQTP